MTTAMAVSVAQFNIPQYVAALKAVVSCLDKDSPRADASCVRMTIGKGQMQLSGNHLGSHSLVLKLPVQADDVDILVPGGPLLNLTSRMGTPTSLVIDIEEDKIVYRLGAYGTNSTPIYSSAPATPVVLENEGILESNMIAGAMRLITDYKSKENHIRLDITPDGCSLTRRVAASAYVQISWADNPIARWSANLTSRQLQLVSYLESPLTLSVGRAPRRLILDSARGSLTILTGKEADKIPHFDRAPDAEFRASTTIDTRLLLGAINWQSTGASVGQAIQLHFTNNNLLVQGAGEPASIPCTITGEASINLRACDLTTVLRGEGPIQLTVRAFIIGDKTISILLLEKEVNGLSTRALLTENVTVVR